MALIRMARMLVALLLVAVAAPAAGAVVHSAPVAGPPAPVVAVAPPVAVHTTGAVSALVTATDDDEDDDPQTIPVEDLLNPDGTLRPDGTFNGAVDISGWNVTLDPDNGPVFSPQALTYTWENLGTGVEGLLNGSVYAIAISGTEVYVGGTFTNAGNVPGASYLARWDGVQWHAVGGANAISGPVYDIAISGTDVYVGGFFFNAGGVPGADYIARWNGTTWSGLLSGTFGISNTVNTIAISGTDVYVGGAFINAGGVPGADYIARWNSANNTWNLVGGASAISGFFSFVGTIVLSGTDVYVGGFFLNAGGVPGANNIARWDGANNTWNLVGGASAINNTVRTIAISGTEVFVGGSFTNAGNVPGADYIARWNSANNTWNLVGGASAINNTVRTIAISGTEVYVGGDFTNAGGMPGASYIARWNSANNTWNLVGAANAINAAVQDIKVSGSSVYIGGQFTNAGGNNANDYLTRWTGSAFVPPGSETTGPLNDTVYAIAISGTEVYVGGNFTNAGNVPGANNIARWDGTTWSGLLSGTFGINNTVTTIALSGTDVLVGGVFTNAGGVPGANNIARWDGTQWHAVGGANAISGLVYDIAISGTDVYVGGIFFNAGGVTGADNIARWNGTTWSGLLSGTFGISSTVTAIAISGTNVFVGGFFFNAGGVPGANNIARWNSANSTWNRLGAPNAINNSVTTIAISGTEVYVGGDFTNAGGMPGANCIARWNSANNTWNLVGAANAVNSTVQAIKVSGSDVYIGGDFTNAGGNSAADYLVRWDGVQWTALVSGTAGVFGPVYALAVPSSDDVYAGGNFLNTGNNPFADYIARYALATKRVYLPLIVR